MTKFPEAQEAISNFIAATDEPITIEYVQQETGYSYHPVRQTLLDNGYYSCRVRNPHGKHVTVWATYPMNRLGTVNGWDPPLETWSCWSLEPKTKKEKEEEKKEEEKDPVVTRFAELLNEFRSTTSEQDSERLELSFDMITADLHRFFGNSERKKDLPTVVRSFVQYLAIMERRMKDGI